MDSGRNNSALTEELVLGAFLAARPEHEDLLERAATILEPRMFARRELAPVFEAAVELRRRGEPVDPGTLAEELRAAGNYGDGTLDLLGQLIDAVPTAANVEAHARIVRHHYERGRIRTLAQRLELAADDDEQSAAEILADARERIELLAAATTNGAGPPGRSGAEILADPDAQTCEVPIAPPLMWRGRLTLLTAREKIGKTSIMAAAAAAVTRGDRWLGSPTTRGSVAWWAGITESTPVDVARLVKSFGGDVSRLYLVEAPGEPFALLERAVETWRPDVLILDSLAALVSGLELESGDAQGWTRVMARLRGLAVGHDCGVVGIHHGNKATGEYRDSTAIGASADVLVALSEGELEGERRLKSVARWAIPPTKVRLVQPEHGKPRYESVGSGLSVDARVLAFIEANPGCSTRALRDGVTGRNPEIDEALRRLLAADHVEDRGGSSGRRLHVVTDQVEIEGVA